MSKNVGILIPSYDGYSDVWPIAEELFKRFWPDRQWPMYWMTNGMTAPSISTRIMVPPMEREEWGNGIALALKSIPEPFILFWVEEVFLLSKVPNALMLEAAELLRTMADVGIIQLTRYYFRQDQGTIGNFTDFPKGTTGFSSAMPALFRKDILLHLLRTLPKSNDFEQQSTMVMQRDFPTVRSLAPCKPMFRFCDNPMIAGVWRNCAINHMREMGFEIDFSKRGIHYDVCRLMDGCPA